MAFVQLHINTNPKYFNEIMQLLYNEWSEIFKESGIDNITHLKNYYKKHTNIRFFFLVNNNKLIACYSFRKINHKLFIGDVLVENSYRQQGYSKLIVRDAFIRAIKEGWSKMYLYTSQKLIPFYQKFGFKVIKKTKMDQYCMMVVLNDQKSRLTQYWFLFIFACVVGILILFVVK